MLCGGYLRESNPLSTRVFHPAAVLGEAPAIEKLQPTGRQEPQAGTRTQAMNVDREGELRIQAPPGAASASESWLQLDGTGMMPEAQERKRSTTAHTRTLSEET